MALSLSKLRVGKPCVAKLTWGFSIVALLCVAGAAYEFNRIRLLDLVNGRA